LIACSVLVPLLVCNESFLLSDRMELNTISRSRLRQPRAVGRIWSEGEAGTRPGRLDRSNTRISERTVEGNQLTQRAEELRVCPQLSPHLPFLQPVEKRLSTRDGPEAKVGTATV
jgi:hypothetical protein